MASKDEILARLDQWRDTHAAPLAPYDDAQARQLLLDAHMTPESIDEHLGKLRLGDGPATPRTIAWYPDLQGLDHIDKADGYFADHDLAKADARAIFQASEIAVLNLRDLAARTRADLDAGQFGKAAEKMAWVNALHHTLHALSQQCPQVIRGRPENAWLSITESDNLRDYAGDLTALHQAILDKGLASKESIARGQLHDPGRFVSFHEFINRNYEDIWRLNLSSVPIPGTSRADAADAAQFYRDFVGSGEMARAVNELHQPGDNFFKQFRCYHQMSEILVKQVNRHLDAAARALLEDGGPATLSHALEQLETAQRLLSVVNDNVRPIVRNISPAQYAIIRSSLGITSGSYSPNIRDGLFALYAPVVQAIQYRIMGGTASSPDQVTAKVAALGIDHHGSEETRLQYALLQQALALGQSVRGWREEHLQNPIQQLGFTASLAGSQSGPVTARRFSQEAHGTMDPVAPIYEGLTGRPYPVAGSLAERFANRPSPGFTQQILDSTNARAQEDYPDVIGRANQGAAKQ